MTSTYFVGIGGGICKLC